MWSPTEDGSKIDNYSLDIGEYTKASVTEMKNKENLGVTSSLNVESNSVKVNVTESPIFVKVSEKKVKENEPEEKEPEPKEPEKNPEPKQPEEKEPEKNEHEIKKDDNKVEVKEEKTTTTQTITKTTTTTKTETKTVVNEPKKNEEKKTSENMKIDYQSLIDKSDKPYKEVEHDNKYQTVISSLIVIEVIAVLVLVFIVIPRRSEAKNK